MKIDEVMLGDIVSISGRPIHVTLAVLNNWSDNIKPIPLTPEILEKSGFNEEQKRVRFVISHKEYQLTYYFNSNWFSIYKNANASGSDYPIFICAFQERIKYVHELQHALKSCRVPKEIIV